MARLVVDSGANEGMVFPLTETVTTMGRGPSNRIHLADKRSSRFHAEIVRSASIWRLRDLQSKNGTHVQGVRVTDECVLHDGDQIRIGQTLFVFEDEEQAATGAGSRRIGTSSVIRLADAAPARTHGSVRAGISVAQEEPVNREQAAAESTESERRLKTLLRIVEKVRSVLDLDRLLTEILEVVFEVFHPERGLILMLDRKTGTLTPRVHKAVSGPEQITISRTIVHQAIRERVSLLISDAATDERFQMAESVVAHHIRSAMCAPLIAQNAVLGVLYVDSLSFKADYTLAELELLTGITDQVAMAISNALLHQSLIEQNRLERELEIARTIQMNLLPKHPPIISAFEVAAMSVPAKHVGGDYYDFIEMDKDHWGMAVADVSGKGVAAAILIASVRAALQVETRNRESGLETILCNLNEMACRDAANDMFIALFFGMFEIPSRRFRYINAGHCCPLFFDANGQETSLSKGGCVLGVLPDRKFEQGEVRLVPRSTLVIFSDGVTDVFSEQNEAFGLNRLRQVIVRNIDATAEELRQAIVRATSAHQGKAEQFDDYTLVVIKAL
jgi:serine phosphatase RsbU (regulator of sigma subunit)/pSer/pThr/pTyr-binding forkhead associated (FHA) protein